MFYWDPTYILVLIGMLICLGASAMVNSAMARYSRVRNSGGITGEEAARRILNNEGLYNVQIECLKSGGGIIMIPGQIRFALAMRISASLP